jgi:hypothetical protein
VTPTFWFQQTKYRNVLCSATQNNCVTEENGTKGLLSYKEHTSKQTELPCHSAERLKQTRNSTALVPPTAAYLTWAEVAQEV